MQNEEWRMKNGGTHMLDAVARSRQAIVELAQDLVRIPSENRPPAGAERAVQDYIRRFWDEAGIECSSFTPDEIPGFRSHPAYCELGRDYSDRPVVVARLRGKGGGRSLILSGHVDTVPVGKAEWTVDPFGGKIKDGRLHGRGSFDMKGGVAAMMMAAKAIKTQGVGLQGDLIVETVPDEEFASSNGTVAACAAGYTADAAVITEPTGLNVVVAHRGFRLAQVAVKGAIGIPVYGAEEMLNPVQHLPPILNAVDRFRRARLGVTGEDTVMITKLAANEFRPDELLTVPPECRVEVYWQIMPDEDIPDVDRAFEAAIRDACAGDAYFSTIPPEISYHLRPMPGSRVPADSGIAAALAAAAEAAGHKPGLLDGFPPNDMFVFNRYAGIPAVVFGPRGDGAHAPDEYVLVDDLITCTDVYARLALDWCGTA